MNRPPLPTAKTAASPTAREALNRITIVLVEPQNPDNIGGVVRAMMNMGLQNLRLVNPKRYDPFRISAAAHRSEEFQKRIEFYDSLEEALADTNLVVAASNRRRRLGPPIESPKTLAPILLEHAYYGRPAILFGREDWGLPNEVVSRCHYQLTIPTNPEYGSLNLAQAVLLVSYELRQAALPQENIFPETIDPKDPPATEAEFTAAVKALLDVLDKAGFFKPGQEPAKRLKVDRLLRRTRPTASEAGLLRAMGYVLDRAVRQGPWPHARSRSPSSADTPES
ncbi:MAG: RNA methyltransferase [Caldilineae bacterium]|nr:MAG: RNA methyltransferase [Caldilineae bacterium]